MGDLANALKSYEDELQIDRDIYNADPNDMRRMLDVAWTMNKLGDFQRRLKDLPAARKTFEEMMTVERRLLEREPASKERHRKVLDGLSKLAGVMMDMGDFAAAKRTYLELAEADERWLALARQLNAKTANDQTRADVVQAYGDAGWHFLLGGRAQASVQYSEAGLKLDGSKTWMRVNLGHAYLFLGRIEEARAIYVAVRNVNRSDDGKRKYSDEIRDDFALFRRLGIGVTAMDRMEREIGI
jgi:tetratricopeptide (TPR) repeat protein